MKFKLSKFWKWFLALMVLLPVVLFSVTVLVIYYNQQSIVQSFIRTANEDFKGEIVLRESHIAPFANFPYISIDLQGLKVYETKETEKGPILAIEDTYIGFDLWTLLSGEFDIKSVKLAQGDIYLTEYGDGSFNIAKAFETYEPKEPEELAEEFHFDLNDLSLVDVDIHKINPDSLEFDVYFNHANIGFRTKKDHLFFRVDTDFNLSMIEKGDTTFLRRKNFKVNSVLDYFKELDSIVVTPSVVEIEQNKFQFSGGIDVLDDFNVDLSFSGQKPDFSLLIALAPDDIIPVIDAFDNRGDVFFDATVKGKTYQDIPYVEARFGCKDGYFKNPQSDKVLDELSFLGLFTNGQERTLESMRVEIKDFNARPETGKFNVNLVMENFVTPEIDLQVTTLFDLDYLAKFFNVTQLQQLKGEVELSMNFNDIIDLENPERTIEQFNEAYYTKLRVTDLGFKFPDYNQVIDRINIDLQLDGNRADLRSFSMQVGKSDIAISGSVSDLPAIIHHSNKEVETVLKIHSDAVDINELTLAKGEVVVDEYIRDFNMDMKFLSSAKALTESPFLPVGRFTISRLDAKLTNYPHALHDFVADIQIDTTNLIIHDFSGEVDKSDFHLKAFVEDYALWFQEKMTGDTKIGLDLTSNLLQFKDIFSFDGENYVPEDYRDEELTNLKVHFDALLHFYEDGMESADVFLTELTGKANIHPMKLERFSGRVHIENDHLTVEQFKGKIGNTSFVTDLEYYYGEEAANQKKKNKLYFNAPRLDFDQLFDYEAPEPGETVDHDSVFSIFDVPFPDMSYIVKIGKMNYHNYLITAINAQLRTTENHMLYVDTLQMDLAGGHMDIGGYFNASDRDLIYFYPTIQVDKINLDKLMLKFDNFGQDEVLSDNLHGIISGRVWGKIHMHADLVPIMDDSEIHIDVDIVGGSIENYGPLEALSGFFEDEKLHKVIFDTLANRIDLVNGVMTVPEMLINTNLGFIKVSGKQDMDMNMEYYLRVPLRMITSAGSKKLMGRRKESDPSEVAEYDPNKRYRYVNIKIVGDAEDFKVSLGKNKN